VIYNNDELRRLTPLAYLALMCLAFWAVMFFAWPFWTGVVIAILFGVIGSYLFGSWIRQGIRKRIKKFDQDTRDNIQNQFDDLEE